MLAWKIIQSPRPPPPKKKSWVKIVDQRFRGNIFVLEKFAFKPLISHQHPQILSAHNSIPDLPRKFLPRLGYGRVAPRLCFCVAGFWFTEHRSQTLNQLWTMEFTFNISANSTIVHSWMKSSYFNSQEFNSSVFIRFRKRIFILFN